MFCLPENYLSRWVQLLEQAEQGSEVDHAEAQVRLDRSGNQHRQRIVACLQAVEAYQAGVSILLKKPVPDQFLPLPACEGARAAQWVWESYLKSTMGCRQSTEWLRTCIHRLAPTALIAGVDDNPEPWWANELLILHAFCSFARMTHDESLMDPLMRCVEFHLKEIQPDHATNEPWAIHAFILHPEGNLTAETLLHAAMVQGSGHLTPVARSVVRDALRALRT
jgi:hypothetical protein